MTLYIMSLLSFGHNSRIWMDPTYPEIDSTQRPGCLGVVLGCCGGRHDGRLLQLTSVMTGYGLAVSVGSFSGFNIVEWSLNWPHWCNKW